MCDEVAVIVVPDSISITISAVVTLLDLILIPKSVFINSL
jgi:hypothetical protein